MALHGQELDFNLREWDRKSHLTRENLSSRRFSTSYIRSYHEDHKSALSNFTISSCTSSPRYSLKGEIDPSTYSFTSALKALQAKTVSKKDWDWLKQQGVELNSKWNEAEKYICNPLSGEVPLECLSSKTLNSRSFRNLSTMILPHSNHTLNNPRTIIPTVKIIHEDATSPHHVLIQEKKVVGLKRDVGVQSAPVNVSPAPIMEKRHVEADDSMEDHELKLKAQQQEEDVELEEENQNVMKEVKEEEKKEWDQKKKKKRGSGCFSWMSKRQRKPTKSKCNFLIRVPHLVKACSSSHQ